MPTFAASPSYFPQLRGWGEAPCKPYSVDAIRESGAQAAFLATPHEASLELVPELSGRRIARRWI